MRISGIYKIQSKIKPERIYIGSSISISKRWNSHIEHLRKNKHYNKKLQRHFNKYGESDLQFTIILGCDKEDLIKIEQYFIDSYNPYFNNCKFAYSRLGQKASPETLLKMSGVRKNKKRKLFSDEWKKNIGRSLKGRNAWNKGIRGIRLSDQTKNKMSKSKMGHITTGETRMKISKANKGYKYTLDQSTAQSVRQLGKKRGKYNKQKIA